MSTLHDSRDVLRLAGADATVSPGTSADLTIRGVTLDSRKVEQGFMFACVRGAHHDGHDHAGEAVEQGAAMLFVDHRLEGVGATPQLIVDDTRLWLGVLAAEIHGHPSGSLRTVGITGTNGKTTTAQMLGAILEHAGLGTGIIGTLHGERTTPEAPELQRRLARFRDDGLAAAVVEVSSHALALHRVDGTRFDAVIFTNLGHDHLDLHGSQEQYFRVKAALFDPVFAPLAVINVDDARGLLLLDSITAGSAMRVVPFSIDDVRSLREDAGSSSFRWRGIQVDVPIGGRFNVSNALAALTTAVELGVDPEVAAAGLVHLPRVPGRFDLVPSASDRGPTVLVDYAHTPDGLDGLLRASRPLVEGAGRLFVVFGCGGERDQAKRPGMGSIAARLADVAVVTSDNPRNENPERIVDDVMEGVDPHYRSRVIRNVDRRAAIGAALEMADTGDVVVIAGKGHERTQDLGTEVVEFDDRAVARGLLEDLK